MIKTIEILITNGPITQIDALLDFEKNICICNNKESILNDDIKKEIVRILRNWENEYGSSKEIDSEEFVITVNADNKDTFHGKGIYPDGYNRIKTILGELYGTR